MRFGVFFFCFYAINLFAQSPTRNSIQVSANLDLTIPHEIQRDYPIIPFGTDLYPKRTFSFGGTLSYQKRIKNKWSYDVGLIGGVDSDFYDVQFKAGFIENDGEKDRLRRFYDFSYLFGGITANLSYDIFQFEKSLVYLKTGISAIYFHKTAVEKGYAIYFDGVRNRVFESEALVNDNPNIFLLSVWEGGYRHSVGQNFFVGLGLNVRVSINQKDYVNGNYRIIGQNEVLTGTYNKWWLSSGLSFYGGYYLK